MSDARLTNAFSKKIENHMAAISLHYMDYNFCHIHQTLRFTPIEIGIAGHLWSTDEMIGLRGTSESALCPILLS